MLRNHFLHMAQSSQSFWKHSDILENIRMLVWLTVNKKIPHGQSFVLCALCAGFGSDCFCWLKKLYLPNEVCGALAVSVLDQQNLAGVLHDESPEDANRIWPSCIQEGRVDLHSASHLIEHSASNHFGNANLKPFVSIPNTFHFVYTPF